MLERRMILPRKGQGFEICHACHRHIAKGEKYFDIDETYNDVRNVENQVISRTYTKICCDVCVKQYKGAGS